LQIFELVFSNRMHPKWNSINKNEVFFFYPIFEQAQDKLSTLKCRLKAGLGAVRIQLLTTCCSNRESEIPITPG
jgi:hypothetical protein